MGVPFPSQSFPSCAVPERRTLQRPDVGLWASVSPSCDRLGPSQGPMLTDNTSISVIFQKAFQKCTSRFCMIRSNSVPRSSGSMAKRPLVNRELAVTPGCWGWCQLKCQDRGRKEGQEGK